MRALKVATVVMAVLIVGGTTALAILIAQRLSGRAPAATAATLQEPPGTRIVQAVGVEGRLALLLQGGGPDRIVLLDPRTLHPAAQITLAPK